MKKIFVLPLAVAALAIQSASAQVSLFTTQGDFTGWSGSPNFTVSAVTTPDLDGATVNGLGSGGGAGTAGSLSAQWNSGTFDYIFSQGEQGNAAFLSALENATTLTIKYTTPPAGSGTYFQIGTVLNYQGQFDQITSGITTTGPDGNGVTTENISFATEAAKLTSQQAGDGGSFSYFQFGLIYNSNFTPGTPFNIDGISVTEAPEPGTLALGALGAVTAWVAARRRKA